MGLIDVARAKRYTDSQLIPLATNSPVETLTFNSEINSIPANVVSGHVLDVIFKGNTDGTKHTEAVRVKSVGKNLVKSYELTPFGETENAHQGYSLYSNKLIFNYNNSSYSKNLIEDVDLVKIKPNQSYTLQAEIQRGRLGPVFLDGELNRISRPSEFVKSSVSSMSFVTPENASYLIILKSFWTADGDTITTVKNTKATNLQVKLGSTATTYEPYKESIVTTPAIGKSLPNGVRDEVNLTKGEKVQRVSGEVSISGSMFASLVRGTNVDHVVTTELSNAQPGVLATAEGSTLLYNSSGVLMGEKINWDEVGNEGKYIYGTDKKIYVITAKDAYPDIGTARTALGTMKLYYQLATPIITKLPKQPLQAFENGTVYIEPIGSPTETTIPTTELTVPTGQGNQYGVATKDYGGAAADWVLSSSEGKYTMLKTTNAGGAVNIVAPDRAGKMFVVNNLSGQTVTIKKAGGTGVAIANGKTALVMHNGSDYIKITGEV